MYGLFTTSAKPENTGERPVEPFNPETQSHRDYLAQQLNRFVLQLKQLQELDKTLAGAVCLTVSCTYIINFSWLMLTAGLLATSYVTHMLPKRAAMFAEYKNLLEELKADYEWALDSDGNKYPILNAEPVQGLIRVIGPLLAEPVKWEDADRTYTTWKGEILELPTNFQPILKKLEQIQNAEVKPDWRTTLYGEGENDFGSILKNWILNNAATLFVRNAIGHTSNPTMS